MSEYKSDHQRPQDDVPIETIYRHLLADYHKEQEKVQKLTTYAKDLETKLREIRKNDSRLRRYQELLEAHKRIKAKYDYLNCHRLYLERILHTHGIPFDPIQFANWEPAKTD